MTNETPEIAYGGKAIAKEISEPDLRKVYYRLERGLIDGAWKAGNTWALTVPVFRKSVGLDPK